MAIFITLVAIFVFILLITFIVIIGNAIAALTIPPQKCPVCETEMKILMSNIYTGQVCYECPKCGKRVSYCYDEDELVRESDNLRCPLNHRRSKTDKE